MTDEETKDLTGEIANMYEDVRISMIAEGVDPNGEFVTFIQLSDDMSQVLKRGTLFECVKKGLELVEEDNTLKPMTAPIKEFMETVKSPATVN